MFCENCGKTIPDNSSACPYCGATTGVGPAPAAAPGSAAVNRLPRLTHPKLEKGIAGFCRPVLQALEEGKVLRTLVALFMRISAVVGLLGALVLAITVVKSSFSAQEVQATIGGLVLALMLILFGVGALFIQFYRAASVATLGDSPFTVIPIVSIYCRAVGEVYALGLMLFGVGVCLFTWFTGRSPGELLGPLTGMVPLRELGAGPFIDGAVALLGGALLGFLVLLAAYFLAEFIAVIPDIARNVRVIVHRGEQS